MLFVFVVHALDSCKCTDYSLVFIKSVITYNNLFLFCLTGENITIKSFSVHDLLPEINAYMTYEGSLTIPGCQETVTWILINKPIFLTRQQVRKMI